MGYQRAEEILPAEVIKLIQEYVDGQTIYIPRKARTRKEWGSGTNIRQELKKRNDQIYKDYLSGMRVCELAFQYCLSTKSIQHIIQKIKTTDETVTK